MTTPRDHTEAQASNDQTETDCEPTMTDALNTNPREGDRRGFVYILTNDSMPGLVKIGRTVRDINVRASELWQTGVPTPFEVFASVGTFDCVQLEAYVHSALHKHRVSKAREFFKVDPFAAEKTLKEWSLLQTELLVGDLDAGLLVLPYAVAVSRSEVERLSQEMGQPPRVIAEAMECLTAEELTPALGRARKRLADEDPEWLGVMDRNFKEGA